MRYAETGVNLEIDLSRGSIEKEETDPRLTELYLGGVGTNAKILWDRVPPEVEPFSPDNLLIFGPGLLTGTLITATNRTIVGTISPVTLLQAHSMAGGFWGPELKYAGYDKVIIRGKSPSWVYLWINNDKVEIRDASHLLGKGNLETAELIRKELKEDKAQVASIGLAGENRVYMATIDFEKSSAARPGVGAIMGDKKLKAIAVRGTKDINIARPAELFELCNEMMKKIRDNIDQLTPKEQRGFLNLSSWGVPDIIKRNDETWHFLVGAWGNARERTKGFWNKEIEKKWDEIMAKARERVVGCYNCPVACTGVITLPGRQRWFLKCGKQPYIWAARIEDLDFGLRIQSLGAEYGLDLYSTPQVIAFALELYEAGILTDEDMAGMPSDTEGRFFWLINKIARREGIGDVLANGTYLAARQIGKGAEAYAHNTVKKLEQVPFKLGMWDYRWFLMEATGEKLANTQFQGLWPPNPLPTREEREEFVKDWIGVPNEKFKQYYVDSDPRSHPTMEAACETVDWMEMMHYIDDSTGMCNGFDSRVRKTPFDIHNLPHFISLATGMALNEAELWRIARRNRTLVRAINVRRGMRRKDETIPEDRYKHRDPETEAKLLDEYYKLKGFNNDGIPTKETLDELGLDYVREDLEQRGIL